MFHEIFCCDNQQRFYIYFSNGTEIDGLHIRVDLAARNQAVCLRLSYVKIRPNKKISVFRVTGLKILGRVVKHFFFFFFLV